MFESKFIDYVANWKHRVEPGGGIGIVLKKNLKHETVTLIRFQNGKLDI